MRFWALAGGVFGLMSVLAGARVLAGIDAPDYVVVRWLVAYNVTAGLAAVVAAAGLWTGRGWGIVAARLVAAAHTSVLLVLVAMRLTDIAVATESLAAMAFRVGLWLAIALGASPGGRVARRHGRG